MSEQRGWLRAGRIGSPHGLDGSFHVSEPLPRLLTLGAEVVVREAPAMITRRAGTDQRPIIRLDGYEDRAAAAALRGAELLVARSEAPELEEDEWWAEELEGCEVRDRDVVVGTVRRMLVLPSCEVLEVARADGADLLVPLIADAVRAVDVERRQIEIDLEFLGER
ncbi:MAG TPA: ribosome maturation factor RimM [Solirubrobacteraceae bacterium]|jgi:16S rRNA processing protein RimM